MKREEQQLADIPDFLSFDLMLKATPSSEGGKRFIYLEASNEAVDYEGEKVLAKALNESSDYFLKFGNIDIDHFTVLGPKLGLPDYMSYEIGRPVAVSVKGETTMVKAELYQGSGPLAAHANMVWESMTQLNPPARWYPSVGGAILAKSIQIDPDTKNKMAVIEKVRWSNIALSRTPANLNVPVASAMPMATFAKSLNHFVFKALEASNYQTDVASLTGGGAIGMQSLDTGKPDSYYQFRDMMADAIQCATVCCTSEGLMACAMEKFNLTSSEASEWVSRFLGDINTNLIRSY